MKKIIIEFSQETYWKVIQGDKYADKLAYDEMIALVSALTMPKERPCLQWMKTREQHNEFEKNIK